MNEELGSDSDVEAVIMRHLSGEACINPGSNLYSDLRETRTRRLKARKRIRGKIGEDEKGSSQDSIDTKHEKQENPIVIENEQRSIALRSLIQPQAGDASKAECKTFRVVKATATSDPLIMKAKELRSCVQDRSFVVRKSDGKSSRLRPEKAGTGVEAAEFVDRHRREVGRFGSQALLKHDRKSFDAAELTRLGCRQPKNQKIPIGLLVTKRKKQKARETRKQDLDLASGMLVRSKRH